MLYLYLFITITLINCAYLFLFFALGKANTKNSIKNLNSPSISVLVYVKNNAEVLDNNLHKILEQDYPDFELILINDASSDNSLEILEAFKEKNKAHRIQISNIHGNETFWGSKKYALTLGIKRAQNEHLLFTDANCKPLTKNWIQEMAKGFIDDKQVILGYSNYQRKKGFFNLLLRFDTLLNAIHYLSFANAKMTYMGVGKNLAYTSQVYYKNRGFISHVKLPVGDDDLFVNEVATSRNINLVWNKDAHIEIEAINSWKDWVDIRKKRAWTFHYYKTKHKLILGIYFLSTFLFWIGLIIYSFFFPWQIILGILLFRLFIQYISIGTLANKLESRSLIIHIPWLEFTLLFLQLKIAKHYIKRPF